MNVLHVVPSLAVRTGGPASDVVGACRAMRDLGVESTVFTTDLVGPASAPVRRNPPVASDLPAGADELDVHYFPTRQPLRFVYAPAMSKALDEAVDSFDLVHVHSLYLYPQYVTYKALRRSGVPYIVSPHGALDPYLRRRERMRKAVVNAIWQRRMLDEAAALHLTTDDESALIEDMKLAAPRVVVPNGVNLTALETLPPPDEFRREYSIDSAAPVVLYHGRLAQKKGIDILIAAFARVKARYPEAVLVLVGPDDEGIGGSLHDLVSKLGIEPAVRFAGLLTGRNLHRALAAGDLWVLPSHTENFGVAVIEAMAAGLPTIVSPYVNIADRIAAADAGLIADNTIEDTAAAIEKLLADETYRKQLAERGRCFANTYDWSNIARPMYEMYANAIARRN